MNISGAPQDIQIVFGHVFEEFQEANERYPLPNSGHEGWSIIYEEVEELREHVRANTSYTWDAYNEAAQIAATALKFMLMIRNRMKG